MPIHDWSRVPAGLFHDFHQTWSIQIKMALNAGIFPKGISALVEQRSGPRESDVLALESRGKPLRRDLAALAAWRPWNRRRLDSRAVPQRKSTPHARTASSSSTIWVVPSP